MENGRSCQERSASGTALVDIEGHKVPHMVGGSGEHSYANNSSVQRLVMDTVKHIVEESVTDLYSSMLLESSLRVGDLGCSAGPNTLAFISLIIDAIELGSRRLSRAPPELVFFLNDLHGNDFNSVFQSLPSFYEKLKTEKGEGFRGCYVGAMPGSFYGRIFPNSSMHFIHSSNSLHWLSQVPPKLTSTLNKGNISLTETSSALVKEAYLEQYKRDFRTFLLSRSEELISGGRMVLILTGRSLDPSGPNSNHMWKLLAQALYDLVSQGRIEEAKVDAFNLPFYAPSVEEVKEVVEREGSFDLNNREAMEVTLNAGMENWEDYDAVAAGVKTAKALRAVTEPMLATHFGAHLMDELFQRSAEIMANEFSRHAVLRGKVVNLIVTLTRTLN